MKIKNKMYSVAVVISQLRVNKIDLLTVITLSIETDMPFANSVDPDQMLWNTASDQGLHCLPYIQQYFRQINR